MAIRVIQKAVVGPYTIKVMGKNEYDEYEVRWYTNGKHVEKKTYYASDKEDAIGTAAKMYDEAYNMFWYK